MGFKNIPAEIIEKVRERHREKLRKKALVEERFIRKVSDEYRDFRKHELSKPREEIYEDAFRIYFYREIYICLHECDEICEDMLSYLSEIDSPLAFLWERYLDTEGYSIETWNDIVDFLTEVKCDYDFCYKYNAEGTDVV